MKHVKEAIREWCRFKYIDEPKVPEDAFDDMTYRMSIVEARKILVKNINIDSMIADVHDADLIYRSACDKTKDETHQAMEALVHNLNTLHSRAGAQVPFSSINYGLCTSPAGRLVIQETLNAVMDGLGHGETAIFPISVFQLKAGVNYNPGDPNYDLFQRACEVSAKRLFPKQNWGLAA